ncbi:MAG TPA: hypothetical protein H9673_04310 [Candidatus Adamsella sp.]|nr:hypothetical protein [Candidatus Adamsella sp.]
MVSAINTDQSELWELLMNQSSQTNSSSSTTQTQESSEADSTSFANLLQESSENNSVDSQLYDMLTDITQNMGVPAGMFIEDASEENSTSVSSASGSSSSSSSGSSSSYDVRDTNMDGVVSQEEIDAALGIEEDNQTADTKLKQQLETAYGLNDDSFESLLSLVV